MPDDLRIIKTRKKLYHALGELMRSSRYLSGTPAMKMI